MLKRWQTFRPQKILALPLYSSSDMSEVLCCKHWHAFRAQKMKSLAFIVVMKCCAEKKQKNRLTSKHTHTHTHTHTNTIALAQKGKTLTINCTLWTNTMQQKLTDFQNSCVYIVMLGGEKLEYCTNLYSVKYCVTTTDRLPHEKRWELLH